MTSFFNTSSLSSLSSLGYMISWSKHARPHINEEVSSDDPAGAVAVVKLRQAVFDLITDAGVFRSSVDQRIRKRVLGTHSPRSVFFQVVGAPDGTQMSPDVSYHSDKHVVVFLCVCPAMTVHFDTSPVEW